MSSIAYLIPLSFALGLAGLTLFLWSLKAGQYEDLDGDAERILFGDDEPLISDDPSPSACSPGQAE